MKKIIICSYIFGLFSCAPSLYIPIQDVNSISVLDLKTGRNLYVNNCGSCHQLHLPREYNKEQWSNNLDFMQPRAKITDAQKQLIYNYLINEPKK